ncbi:Tfp pilus assembly protein FimT/FimU [Acidobacteriota bacterium]
MRRTRTRLCTKHEAGFSLTEILVVLMLFAMFMLIAIPNVSRWHSRYVLTNGCRRSATMLKLARMKAVATNTRYDARIFTSPDSGKLKIEIYPTGNSSNVTEVTELHNHVYLDPSNPTIPNNLKMTFTYKPNGTVIYYDTSDQPLSNTAKVSMKFVNIRNTSKFVQQIDLYYSGGVKVHEFR